MHDRRLRSVKRKTLAGTTSMTLGVFVQDTSSTTGAGLAITHASSGLVFEYRRQGQSAWTSVTPVTATLGTYTSGGVVADGALTGAIEIGVPDAAVAAGARFCLIRLRGVANMLPVLIEMELDAVDYQNATSFGLSRLDAAVTSRMATYTQPTGFLAATFPTTVASTTNITAASGVTVSAIGSNVITAASIAAGALDGKGNWNIGKTGYALTATTGLGNQTANITGNLSGSVGSVTGAVTTSAFSGTASTVILDIQDQATNANIEATIASAMASKFNTMIEVDGAAWQFTAAALDQAPSGGGGGSTDWTANERTAIRAILGIPASGTTPTDPTTGILDTIRDLVTTVDTVVDAILVDTDTTIPATLATIAGYIDTEVAAVKSVTDKLDTAMQLDGSVWRFTTNALEMAPSGGGGGGDPWTTDLATGYTGTQAGNILNAVKAKTDLINAGSVPYASPVTASGKFTAPIIKGDDYLAANGRAFTWTITAITGITASTAVVRFAGKSRVDNSTFTVNGTATDIGGSKWTLSCSMTRDVSGALTLGEYDWSVEVTSASGTEVTPVRAGADLIVASKF
jgi:hypothetical protein